MKLKSLELQGFKSFPEKTILSFEQGVTAVVGPNGSGKSNISDAIRWVLGEITARSIRGNKMEDLIFNGSESRKPMGFCEVSLTIDNTDPESRMNIEYDEVTVTRRYYRSGKSEYFINRQSVPLKEITDLFMNTGIGRSGYSIIGQGKAAEIISQKSEERRTIFEEAAGIAKYRHKKDKAERDLEAVEDNLVRVNDILQEIESRVGPLEKEADKARRYLDLYNEKKADEVALNVYDINNIKSRQNSIQSNYNIASRELEAADEAISENESKSERLYEQTQNDKLRYEELNRLKQEATEKRFGFESSGKVYENEISHTKELRDSAIDKINIVSKQIEEANSKHAVSISDNEKLKDELVVLVQKEEELSRLIEDKDEEISILTESIDSLNSEITLLEADLVDAKVRLSALDISDKSGDERKSELEEEASALSISIKNTQERLNKSEEVIAGYSKNTNDISDTIDSGKSQVKKLSNDIYLLNNEINSLNVDISSKEHKADTLSRMEATLDGYSHSVRKVMSEAENGTLHGICGPVSQLISTSSKHSAAIESALGAMMQNIIVESEADAKSAIRFLRENKAGRATFYPLTTIKPSHYNEKEFNFRTFRGFIGVANEITNCDDKYRNVVDYLLCRTVVFDNLDNANAMAKASGFKIRVVTLDGQLINAGGSFTGGSQIRESGMLTRSNDIATLKDEVKTLKIKLKEAIEKKTDKEKELEELQASVEDEAAKSSLFATLISAENAQAELFRKQIEIDTEKLNSLRANIDGIDQNIKEAKEAYLKTQSDISQYDIKIRNTQNIVSEKIAARKELVSKQDEYRREHSEYSLNIAIKRREIESSEANITNEEVNIKLLTTDKIKAENDVVTYDDKLSEYATQIEIDTASAQRITDELISYENELDEISKRNLESEEKSTYLRNEAKDLQHKREVIFRSYTKLEAEKNSIETENDKLIAHLWDEYELTYSAACEMDLPEITEENRKQINVKVNELRSKIRQLGPVNVNAIEEYAEIKERFDSMSKQFKDITKSREDLVSVIHKLEKEMRERFVVVFNDINKNFKVVFKELFGGGNANIYLTDPDDALNSGIEIEVAPPGKIIGNLSLLSGGEQSFTAIALLFSILKVNPTPYVLFDEIEAALDEVNVARFADYCKKSSDNTQFILITHRRGSMEVADMLYGITMYERGISKVLSVNVNDVEKKLGVKL